MIDDAADLLILGVVACALAHVHWARPRAGRYVTGALGGLALVYVLHFADRPLGLWGSLGLDFSTHTAVAVSLATSMACSRLRWLWLLVPLLGAYSVVMVEIENHHSWADVITSVPLPILLTWLSQRLIGVGAAGPAAGRDG